MDKLKNIINQYGSDICGNPAKYDTTSSGILMHAMTKAGNRISTLLAPIRYNTPSEKYKEQITYK